MTHAAGKYCILMGMLVSMITVMTVMIIVIMMVLHQCVLSPIASMMEVFCFGFFLLDMNLTPWLLLQHNLTFDLSVEEEEYLSKR